LLPPDLGGILIRQIFTWAILVVALTVTPHAPAATDGQAQPVDIHLGEALRARCPEHVEGMAEQIIGSLNLSQGKTFFDVYHRLEGMLLRANASPPLVKSILAEIQNAQIGPFSRNPAGKMVIHFFLSLVHRNQLTLCVLGQDCNLPRNFGATSHLTPAGLVISVPAPMPYTKAGRWMKEIFRSLEYYAFGAFISTWVINAERVDAHEKGAADPYFYKYVDRTRQDWSANTDPEFRAFLAEARQAEVDDALNREFDPGAWLADNVKVARYFGKRRADFKRVLDNEGITRWTVLEKSREILIRMNRTIAQGQRLAPPH
jgi:hypothetical protein